jgi:1A family penicillin-binding protein
MAKRLTRKVKYSTDPASRAKRFITSFHPDNFRAYWLNRDGLKRLGKIAGVGALAMFLLLLFVLKDLPNPKEINARLGAQTTRFYDRKEAEGDGKGTVLYEIYGDKNRSVIKFEQIPDNLKQATIAIEDKNFYKHGAFSSVAIVRATIANLTNRGTVQGGSTITQQYVKNALLSSERTFSRKVREVILSIVIEQFYNKDDILSLYLNEIPYGNNAYGVQAAAKTYFKKDLSKGDKLELDEAATLAAIPRAPTLYSPYGNYPDRLRARKNTVLDQMAQQGMVSKAEAEAAKKIDPVAKIKEIHPIPSYFANVTAPHFVKWVQESLQEKYGDKFVSEGGLKVITTIDLEKQKHAEDAIARGMRNVEALGGSNAAMVASDPKTGQILAMTGSRDFEHKGFGQVNVATSERQPGSSFKPIVYATAFAQNYGPGTTLYDVPTDFGGGYKPENYTDRTYGVQSMRTSLAGSLNITSVKTLYLAGVDRSIEQARKMGITTMDDRAKRCGLSLVLGCSEVRLYEMVNAYESFANGGVHHNPTGVLKVIDAKKRVIEEFKPNKQPKRALDPQVAYLISSVLSDNPARAYIFGNILNVPGQNTAVKTGTTENYRDAWTIGYTPSLVAGVWAGNNDNRSMTKAASAVSAPIWKDFMQNSLKGKPAEPFQRPTGIKEVTLDANTGKAATEGSKAKRTDVFASWYKPTPATNSRSAKVDKVSGKLATECTPPLAIETAYSSEIHAEIPSSDPAYGRWEPPVQALAASLGFAQGGNLPTESDDVHRCTDDKPKVELEADSLGGGSYRLTAEVTSGTHQANRLEVRLDDQIISTQSIAGSTTYRFNHTIKTNGSHFFKATVIDAALYTDEDAVTVTVSDAGSGDSFEPLSPANGTSYPSAPGAVTFSWTSMAAADRYRLIVRRNGSNFVNQQVTSSSSNQAIVLPGTYTWYVEAYDGSDKLGTTTTYTFTVS